MKSETQKSKKTIKNYVVNIGIALFTIILCCFVAEGVIRILKKDTMVLFPRYHTDATYGEYRIRRMRPNSDFWHRSSDGAWKFTINKQGYRSSYDFSYDKPSDVIRVIALGDSQTQGYEVGQDSTYSAVIEKYLSNRGYKAEVYNMGVSGFSTAEELVLLENEGVKYKPDYVILAFYANDFEDNVKAGLFGLNDGKLTVVRKEHLPGVRIQNLIYSMPFVSFLSENSYFYNLLFNTTWGYYKKLSRSTKENQLATEYAIPTEELTEYKVQLASRLIERMYSFCRKNNIKLIICNIPIIHPDYVKSPMPEEMYESAVKNCDIFIESEKVLEDYNKLIELRREHGSRHISEFTHCLLGVRMAKEIVSREEAL